MIDFPEGVELYGLLAAGTGVDVVTFTTDDYQGRTVTEVHKMRGPWGWSEDLRIFVVFDGASVPIFETPLVTDAEISLECASGDRILALEREERINLRPNDPLRRIDEDDLEFRG
jgi:hypothetical protein|tara:strand:- start:1405 stop:1749 length:345 start_codon:yes stop_codon:yes gene_type:complete